MKHFSILILFLFVSTRVALAQETGGEWCAHNKAERFKKASSNARIAYPGDQSIDVKYHFLDLKITPETKTINGIVRTYFTANQNLNAVFFDLKSSFKVDSVVRNSKKLAFTQGNNKLNITLDKALAKDELANVTIYYVGVPPTSNFGSFEFGTHGAQKAPAIWSLSEPYGAPDWWPCKDDPSDKIDSSTVWITLPSFYTSVSNGRLVGTLKNLDNNTSTYQWKNKHPISHYLISIACSNYTLIQDLLEYKGDSIPIEHYIYPEVLTTNLQTILAETKPLLAFFTDLFGSYPFHDEKYGHAMCNFGGGMEHQTVSSMGGFTESLIAHEMAHQWFGDKITCKTWSDIFVNEAFASYSEALYDEFKYGKARYQNTLNGHFNRAKTTKEPVYISDPTNENLIFNYALTYGKGAVVLHMLRGVLGDADFFNSLKAYQESEFAYKSATIDDFRNIAEKTSKKDLKYFFDEWIYGTSYPRFQYGWTSLSKTSLKLNISQQKLTTNPEFFTMPVELTLKLKNNTDTTVKVFVDKISSDFEISGLKAEVNSVVFDPNNLILKDVQEVGIITSNAENLPDVTIFPNPNAEILKIDLKGLAASYFEIRNTNGQLIKNFPSGQKEINIKDLSTGKYFLIIKSDSNQKSIPFIKN
jgi:aminopeptidase N